MKIYRKYLSTLDYFHDKNDYYFKNIRLMINFMYKLLKNNQFLLIIFL